MNETALVLPKKERTRAALVANDVNKYEKTNKNPIFPTSIIAQVKNEYKNCLSGIRTVQ